MKSVRSQERGQNQPLTVSMGQYAASGGYYISCAGRHITADPATITGSIGVVGENRYQRSARQGRAEYRARGCGQHVEMLSMLRLLLTKSAFSYASHGRCLRRIPPRDEARAIRWPSSRSRSGRLFTERKAKKSGWWTMWGRPGCRRGRGKSRRQSRKIIRCSCFRKPDPRRCSAEGLLSDTKRHWAD